MTNWIMNCNWSMNDNDSGIYWHVATVYTKGNWFVIPLSRRYFGDGVTQIPDLSLLKIAHSSEHIWKTQALFLFSGEQQISVLNSGRWNPINFLLLLTLIMALSWTPIFRRFSNGSSHELENVEVTAGSKELFINYVK